MNHVPEPTKPRALLAALTVALAAGLVALALSIQGAFTNSRQDDEREAERIASDLASCERGNDNKAVNRRLAEAQRDYVDQTVDVVGDFAELDPAEVETLDALLAPARSAITEAITAIVDVDCLAVVPGAQEAP